MELRTPGAPGTACRNGPRRTFVGLALIERALRTGERVLVLTPTALRRDWHRELAALAPLLREPERAAWAAVRPRPASAPANLEFRLEEPRPPTVAGVELLTRLLADHPEWRCADPVAPFAYALREVCALDLVPDPADPPDNAGNDAASAPGATVSAGAGRRRPRTRTGT